MDHRRVPIRNRGDAYDIDAYEEWKSKLSPLGITVSDWLERTATVDERVRKIDLADRIFEERLVGC